MEDEVNKDMMEDEGNKDMMADEENTDQSKERGLINPTEIEMISTKGLIQLDRYHQ